MANAFLSDSRAGENQPWRYLVCTPLALILALASVVLLAFAARAAHVLPPDLAAELRRPSRPVVFFTATGLVFFAFLGGFAAAVALVHRKNPARVPGTWSWRSFATAFIVWTALEVLATLFDVFVEHVPIRWRPTPSFWGLFAAAVPALVVQTFTEEYVFRGYATQGFLLGLRRPWIAAVASGTLFGALHIPNGWPQAASALVFGVVLALTAIRTGGLAFGYGMHLANNLFAGLIVVSSDDVFSGAPGLFSAGAAASSWVDVVIGSILMIATARLFAPAPGIAARSRFSAGP